MKNLRPYSVTEIVRDGQSITVYRQKEGKRTRVAAFQPMGPDNFFVIWGDEKRAGEITLDDKRGSFTYYAPAGEKETWLIRGENEMALNQFRSPTNAIKKVLVTHTYNFNGENTITGIISDFGHHKLMTYVEYEGLNRLNFITKDDPEAKQFWYRTDVVVPRIQFSRLSRVAELPHCF